MKGLISFATLFFAVIVFCTESHAQQKQPVNPFKRVYYFTSNRDGVAEKYTRYKARTKNNSISSCIIKGNFKIQAHENMHKAEISVYNISNDQLVGIYNTNPVTGNYLVVLIPNVRYEFVINTYGYAPFKKIVEIPEYTSTDAYGEISTQKMELNISEKGVNLSLNTWLIDKKEPTLFLMTVYDEKNENKIELYEANNTNPIGKARRQLKETDFSTIDELLQKHADEENKKPELAAKAFLKKDYQSSINLYSQLLDLNPNNALANYRMGKSLFLTEQNKLKALPYLKKAAKNNKTPYEVFYLLGKSYHLLADFGNAYKALEKYKAKATKKEILSKNINRLIKNCKNGEKIMQNQLNMQVISKKAITSTKLPENYPNALVADKLLEKTTFFISPIDAKKKEKLLMFKTEQNEMIQTSYGLKGNNKDLFVNILMGGDKWGIPKSLGDSINTKYDEDYAYVTLDGRTMYFSSKGHNSIGGYDIFKSTRKSSTSPWGKPVNLGYPINSPYDDILFIPDFTGNIAYFSSNRRNPIGGYNLFEIKMPKPPLPLTIIKGHFMTNDSIPNFSASIAVYNSNNQEIVGVYNSNANNGKFLMALMPGIKYQFIINCDKFKEHIAYVTIPSQQESFPLRQNIRLKKDRAFEILNIDNYFTKQEVETAPEFTKTKADFISQAKKNKKKSLSKIETKFQKPNSDQQQILNQAKQLFTNKQYLKCVTLYNKVAPLINLTPKQSYYYGKSLFNISHNYEKTLKYLEQAAKNKNVPYDVYFMLGKTNHNAYRFERAVKAYEKYKSFASEKEQQSRNLETALNKSKFGGIIVNTPKAVEIIAKKEFPKNYLYNIYASTDIKGKFLLTPTDMLSSIDKKEKFKSIMFLNKNKNVIYYPSYGKDGANGKDIFVMKKLPDNSWSKPLNLGLTINTIGDENYPFLTSDGKTLYFSSTKHGSMGGYDIFKSTWIENTKSWSKPVNLGAPINSPFDDLFYVE